MEDPSEYSLALAPFRSLHLDYCYRKTSQNQNKNTQLNIFFFFFCSFSKKDQNNGMSETFCNFHSKVFYYAFLEK